jgi:dihydrofolate reductase
VRSKNVVFVLYTIPRLLYDAYIELQRRSIIMRKLITSLFITMDGVVQSPEKWSFDSFTDEGIGAELQRQLDVQDAVLLGRVTYQEWAGYWPTSTDEPFASFINSTPKYVASTTLDTVEWSNSSLLKGDVAEAITALKQQSGQNIGTAGSPTLVHYLLEKGLVDELCMMVYPVIAGSGRRLFQDGSPLKRMQLVSSTPTPSGVMILRYTPHGNA